MPPLKLYENDKPVKPIWDLIAMNIRVPKERVAEIHAQHRAGVLVEERLLGYVEKFGAQRRPRRLRGHDGPLRAPLSRVGRASCPTARTSSRTGAIATSARRTSRRSASICKMTIEGDQVTMDWTGCDPAPIASWGFARPALQSATYDGTMHCFPELAPLNHGVVRAIEIISTKGTCVDVVGADAGHRLLLGRLREGRRGHDGLLGPGAAEGRSAPRARRHGQPAELLHRRHHPKTGSKFVSYMWLEGGQGARAYADGNSFYMMIFIGGASNQPNETLERWYPMVYTQHRGGGRLVRRRRVPRRLRHLAQLPGHRATPSSSCSATASGSARSGSPAGPTAARTWWSSTRGPRREENLGMFTTKAKLKEGDQLEFGSNGGGGYGLPWERKVESVLEDVIDELLSMEKARDVYGVAITEVDADALDLRGRRGGDRAAARGARRATSARAAPAPFEVNPLGEELFAEPRLGTAELGVTDGRLMPSERSTPRACRRRSGPYSNVVTSAPGKLVFVAGPGRARRGRRDRRARATSRRRREQVMENLRARAGGGGRDLRRRRARSSTTSPTWTTVRADGGGPQGVPRRALSRRARWSRSRR